MPTLPEIASERSGVPLDEAFSIDEVQLATRLPQAVFVSLSTGFYDRVFADEEGWFRCGGARADHIMSGGACGGSVRDRPRPACRDIFATSSKEAAIQNQYEFFIQRMGGPPLYSQRKGAGGGEGSVPHWHPGS